MEQGGANMPGKHTFMGWMYDTPNVVPRVQICDTPNTLAFPFR